MKLSHQRISVSKIRYFGFVAGAPMMGAGALVSTETVSDRICYGEVKVSSTPVKFSQNAGSLYSTVLFFSLSQCN